MKQETQELQNLPLSFLISAPLNAAIEAQRASALSTAAFIEQVGYLPKNKKLSLFADTTNTYDVRQAVVSYEQDEIQERWPHLVGQNVPFLKWCLAVV